MKTELDFSLPRTSILRKRYFLSALARVIRVSILVSVAVEVDA